MNGIKNSYLNIKYERNINGQNNPPSRNANDNSDSFYDDESLVNTESNNKKGHIGNNYIDGQRKEADIKDVHVDSNLINEDGNMKIHKMVTPRNYNLVAFDGSAQQKSSLRKQNADVVYKDVTSNLNINDKKK